MDILEDILAYFVDSKLETEEVMNSYDKTTEIPTADDMIDAGQTVILDKEGELRRKESEYKELLHELQEERKLHDIRQDRCSMLTVVALSYAGLLLIMGTFPVIMAILQPFMVASIVTLGGAGIALSVISALILFAIFGFIIVGTIVKIGKLLCGLIVEKVDPEHKRRVKDLKKSIEKRQLQMEEINDEIKECEEFIEVIEDLRS